MRKQGVKGGEFSYFSWSVRAKHYGGHMSYNNARTSWLLIGWKRHHHCITVTGMLSDYYDTLCTLLFELLTYIWWFVNYWLRLRLRIGNSDSDCGKLDSDFGKLDSDFGKLDSDLGKMDFGTLVSWTPTGLQTTYYDYWFRLGGTDCHCGLLQVHLWLNDRLLTMTTTW